MKKVRKSISKDSVKMYSTDEMKRYLGAINEHNDDNFKVVKEGIDGINQKLEIVQSDVEIIKNNLNQKIDRYEFEALNRRVSAVEKKIF